VCFGVPRAGHADLDPILRLPYRPAAACELPHYEARYTKAPHHMPEPKKPLASNGASTHDLDPILGLAYRPQRQRLKCRTMRPDTLKRLTTCLNPRRNPLHPPGRPHTKHSQFRQTRLSRPSGRFQSAAS
jgi:hypothetical protein